MTTVGSPPLRAVEGDSSLSALRGMADKPKLFAPEKLGLFLILMRIYYALLL